MPPYHLPADLLKGLRGVDLILHAGDICTAATLRELEAVAPVTAVAGNCDAPDLLRTLPVRRTIEIESSRIGLLHGNGSRTALKTAREALSSFDHVDCVVFGHSHQPHIEEENGVLFLNPGSPTWKRFAPSRTFGILTLGSRVRAEIRHLV